MTTSPIDTPAPTTPRSALGVALVVGGALWSLFGAASAAAGPTQDPESVADAAAVRALTEPGTPVERQLAALPAGLDRVTTSSGYPVKVDGDCSSVVPLPDEFTDACRAHDLGYDLLRHAAAQGRPLGDWARDRLDAVFGARLAAVCAGGPPEARTNCLVTARIMHGAVRLNSWRQHSGVPGVESPRELAVSWITGGGRW